MRTYTRNQSSEQRRVGDINGRGNLPQRDPRQAPGVQPVSPRKDLSEEIARVRRKLASIRNGGFAALDASSSQDDCDGATTRLQAPCHTGDCQQADDGVSDIMTDSSECSDEICSLPASESMAMKSAAIAKQILEVEGLDLDDMDMYMLSVQGMVGDTASSSGCENNSVVTSSVHSGRSAGKSSIGTASTTLSSVSTTSTRSRRRGAAHGRRWKAEIAAIKTNQMVSGWSETMHAASRSYNSPEKSSWHPKRGWSYRPMEEQFSSKDFRLTNDELSEGIWEECSPFESGGQASNGVLPEGIWEECSPFESGEQ